MVDSISGIGLPVIGLPVIGLPVIGLQGIQRGVSSAVDAAEKITANAANGEFRAEDFVQLSQARHQVAAASKLFAVDREINKAVLDIVA